MYQQVQQQPVVMGAVVQDPQQAQMMMMMQGQPQQQQMSGATMMMVPQQQMQPMMGYPQQQMPMQGMPMQNQMQMQPPMHMQMQQQQPQMMMAQHPYPSGPVDTVSQFREMNKNGDDDEDQMDDPTLTVQQLKLKSEDTVELNRTYLWVYNIFMIALAFISIGTGAGAYSGTMRLKSDIDSTLKNWNTQPVANITFSTAADGSCPSGYGTTPALSIPSGFSACSCKAGAKYLKEGYWTNATSSYSKSCTDVYVNDLQISIPSDCQDLPGKPSVHLTRWHGATFCYKRDFANAYDQEIPIGTGTCPNGFHMCGSGLYNESRAICEPNNYLGCPLNWAGSNITLSDYSGVDTSDLSADNMGAEPLLSTDGKKVIHKQKGKSNVVKLPVYSPLPMIDLEMTWGYQTDPVNKGVCKGTREGGGIFANTADLNKKFNRVKGTSDGGYMYEIDGKSHSNFPCQGTTFDSRYKVIDYQTEEDLVKENILYHEYCRDLPNGITDPNYFTNSSSKCTITSPFESLKCLTNTDPSSVQCSTNDKVCEAHYYQTKCGFLLHTSSLTSGAGRVIGLYQRSQIYWDPDCPYSIDKIKDTHGPLSVAIEVQLAVLIVSIILNVFICLFYFNYLYLLFKFGVSDDISHNEENKLLKKFEEGPVNNALIGSKWIKMPLTLTTVILIAQLQNFYVTLKDHKCSDDETNETFTQLGNELPAVFQVNLVTFIVDAFLAIVLPILLYIYEKITGKREEKVVPITNID